MELKKGDQDKLIYKDLKHVASLGSLFKYININSGILALKNCNIYFNSPLQFNDPYDCDTSLIEIESKYFEKLVKIEFQKFKSKFSTLAAIKKMKTPNLTVLYPSFKNDMKHQLKKDLLSQTRITCFSEVPTNPLMWAHYSNKHMGICIEYDSQQLIIYLSKINRVLQAPGFFLKVDYKETLSKVYYDEGNYEKLLEWVRAKSKDWSYEREIRYVVPNWKDSIFGNSLPINNQIIKKIYLGNRIKAEDELKVKQICKTDFPHVQIVKMALSDKEYGLEEVPVS